MIISINKICGDSFSSPNSWDLKKKVPTNNFNTKNSFKIIIFQRYGSNKELKMVSESFNRGKVISTDLHSEMSKSYMEYAMSVIYGRALPDVRDGLKPVHRRILFAMYDLGLHPNTPFRKCAEWSEKF